MIKTYILQYTRPHIDSIWSTSASCEASVADTFIEDLELTELTHVNVGILKG